MNNKLFPFSISVLCLVFMVMCLYIINTHLKQLQTKSTIDWAIVDTIVTAYDSEKNQTDSSPYMTTTQEKCVPGGIAVSRPLELLAPIGSIIIIDGIEYTVNDRMDKRWHDLRADIWMPDKDDAIRYGKQEKRVVIIVEGKSD